MTKLLSRKTIVCLALILSITVIGILSLEYSPAAAEEYVKQDELYIIHISDLHYYPLRHCSPNYQGDYKADIDMGTKLAEPSAALKHQLELIYEQNPDYVVLSGDNTYNGERAGHIDVANALRDLQNRIRADYDKPGFQIFVAFGNHDIYNPNTYRYLTNGDKVDAPNVSRKDLSVIYSSLGFPDISEEEALAFYTEEELNATLLPYEGDGDAFINSSLAPNLTVAWQYIENGIQDDEDFPLGELSYLAIDDNDYFFLSVDEELSNEEDGHLLDGRLFASTVDFIDAHAPSLENKTGIAIMHHSAVLHFTEEYNIFTGFILDNYVTATDYLADMGVRYTFTGHVHANNIAGHTSYNLNRILDIQTTSLFSGGGGYRKAYIERGTKGDILTQKFHAQSYVIREIDFSSIIDAGYLPMQYLADSGNSRYFDGRVCTDMSDYASSKLLGNVIDDYTYRYLDMDVILGLIGGIKDKLPSYLSGIAPMIDKIIVNLINQIEVIGLADYQYKGEHPAFQDGNNKLFAYLKDMVDNVVNIQTASDGTNIFEFVTYCYLTYVQGEDVTDYDRLPANIKESFDNMRSGDTIKQLVDYLVNNDDSLYNVLLTVFNSKIDLTADLTQSEIKALKTLGTLVGYPKFDPAAIDLALLAEKVIGFIGLDFDLNGLTFTDFLSQAVKDYITDSLYTGLGNIGADILYSFAVDTFPEGRPEQLNLITFEEGDEFTFTTEEVPDNPTIENGKLPGMLAVNFGDDPKTAKNFVYFTDSRIEDTAIAYYPFDNKPFDIAKATVKSGDTEIYAMRRPLIDVGLLAVTKTTIEKARHTISLTGLQPGTTYYYRIGSVEDGYLSPVYTFKTAPADNAPFEALLISDLQGYTAAEYRQAAKILASVNKVFDLGYDFVIDMGDSVDSSSNIKQYGYYLDIPQAIWANTTMVSTTGNHETKVFEPTDDYVPSSSEVVTSAYNYMVAHHNFSYPSQDTSTGVYYSFDYSGVHFTVLNTNDIEDNKLGEAQYNWLIADLEGADKEYKVVIMHKGPYTKGSHSYDADVEGLRAQLTPVFPQYGVSLVLQGHDHTYTESYYLDEEGKPVNLPATGKQKLTKDKGTLYINLGTLGNKYYDYKDNEDVPVAYGKGLANPTFGKLYFDGKDLYYQGYEYDLASDTIKELNPYGLLTNIIVAGAVVVTVLAAGAFVILREIKIKRAK